MEFLVSNGEIGRLLSEQKGESMSKDQLLLLAGIGLVVGVILLSSPRCTGGCRTVAKYVTQHAAHSLVVGLLAA